MRSIHTAKGGSAPSSTWCHTFKTSLMDANIIISLCRGGSVEEKGTRMEFIIICSTLTEEHLVQDPRHACP